MRGCFDSVLAVEVRDRKKACFCVAFVPSEDFFPPTDMRFGACNKRKKCNKRERILTFALEEASRTSIRVYLVTAMDYNGMPHPGVSAF